MVDGNASFCHYKQKIHINQGLKIFCILMNFKCLCKATILLTEKMIFFKSNILHTEEFVFLQRLYFAHCGINAFAKKIFAYGGCIFVAKAG